jgi:hypothetical protein
LLRGIDERIFTSGLEERVFTRGLERGFSLVVLLGSLEEKGEPPGLCRERLANLPSPEPEAFPNP